MTSKIVNSAQFQTSEICQILSFLRSPKVFRVEILHIDKVQYCPHQEILFRLFKSFKCCFKILKNKGLHGACLHLGFPSNKAIYDK
jgi:hypothetical protein